MKFTDLVSGQFVHFNMQEIDDKVRKLVDEIGKVLKNGDKALAWMETQPEEYATGSDKFANRTATIEKLVACVKDLQFKLEEPIDTLVTRLCFYTHTHGVSGSNSMKVVVSRVDTHGTKIVRAVAIVHLMSRKHKLESFHEKAERDGKASRDKKGNANENVEKARTSSFFSLPALSDKFHCVNLNFGVDADAAIQFKSANSDDSDNTCEDELDGDAIATELFVPLSVVTSVADAKGGLHFNKKCSALVADLEAGRICLCIGVYKSDKHLCTFVFDPYNEELKIELAKKSDAEFRPMVRNAHKPTVGLMRLITTCRYDMSQPTDVTRLVTNLSNTLNRMNSDGYGLTLDELNQDAKSATATTEIVNREKLLQIVREGAVASGLEADQVEFTIVNGGRGDIRINGLAQFDVTFDPLHELKTASRTNGQHGFKIKLHASGKHTNSPATIATIIITDDGGETFIVIPLVSVSGEIGLHPDNPAALMFGYRRKLSDEWIESKMLAKNLFPTDRYKYENGKHFYKCATTSGAELIKLIAIGEQSWAKLTPDALKTFEDADAKHVNDHAAKRRDASVAEAKRRDASALAETTAAMEARTKE